MSDRLPLAISGLWAAAGVALAAVAAHAKPGSGLDSASHMLIVHALAIIGATALARGDALQLSIARFAVWIWLIGAALFSGDIALRAFYGTRLFPLAAPLGGASLIAGWLVFALSATLARKR